MNQPRHSRPSLPAASITLLLAGVLTGGCAAAPVKHAVFPPPPDKGRIEHVRSFMSEYDLRAGFWSRLAMSLFPSEEPPLVNSYGIALSPDEKTLYVATPIAKRVIAIDRESGRFRGFGHTEDNRLGRPIGVATDAAGNIYVADRDLSAIFVYDPKLKLTRKIGAGQLKLPTLLAIDRARQVLYVINDAEKKDGKHAVEVFTLKGEHLRTIGGVPGTTEGYFYFPKGVAVAPNGDLFVSDLMNFRIQVFDPEGRFLRSIGEQGSGVVGKFDKVQGVAWDAFGDLYVVDSTQGVQILNDRLQPLMAFNGGFFQVPVQIAIDSRNRIFVVDYISGLHEFQLINTTKDETYGRPAGTKPEPAKPDTTPAAPRPSDAAAAPAPEPAPTP